MPLPKRMQARKEVISKPVGSVDNHGTTTVKPDKTTTYVLTVTTYNYFGEPEPFKYEVTITVVP